MNETVTMPMLTYNSLPQTARMLCPDGTCMAKVNGRWVVVIFEKPKRPHSNDIPTSMYQGGSL